MAASATSGGSTSASAPACHALSRRLEKFGAPTVWEEFTPLARALGAVNLGQGFPDWASPRFVKDAIVRAVEENHNQYCRSAGHPALVQALAKRYSAVMGREINWETEVTIGVGSTEVLFSVMQSFINPPAAPDAPRDEVVLISPAFDIYAAQVEMAGGASRYVPLRVSGASSSSSSSSAATASAADGGAGATAGPSTGAASESAGGSASASGAKWTLDLAELRAAFTDRTRILLLNTPQNPTGKMFSREELEGIAAILRDFPKVIVVSDEVYENMTYDDKEHVRIATLPGMWDRTITVASAGKTFSITGWKIGWGVGPAGLIKGLVTTNQWVQFSVSTPAQQAVAYCLERAEQEYEGYPSYYHWLRAEYSRKRDILTAALRSAGLVPIEPEGSFFIIADTSSIAVPEKYLAETTPASGSPMCRDWAFCRFLVHEVGVAAIPPSAFFEGKDKALASNLARFAFCKEDASLYEAAKRLQGLRKYLVDPSIAASLPAHPVAPGEGVAAGSS